MKIFLTTAVLILSIGNTSKAQNPRLNFFDVQDVESKNFWSQHFQCVEVDDTLVCDSQLVGIRPENLMNLQEEIKQFVKKASCAELKHEFGREQPKDAPDWIKSNIELFAHIAAYSIACDKKSLVELIPNVSMLIQQHASCTIETSVSTNIVFKKINDDTFTREFSGTACKSIEALELDKNGVIKITTTRWPIDSKNPDKFCQAKSIAIWSSHESRDFPRCEHAKFGITFFYKN
jgi:hypothetical protein